MRFQIQFTGRLKSGVSREETVAVLTKLSKRDAQYVEAKYFGAKPSTIKQFEDLPSAQAYQEKLLRIGLQVEIVDTDPVDQSGSGSEPEDNPVSPSVLASKGSKRNLLVWVGVCIVILVSAAYFGLSLWLQPSVSTWVIKAENAVYSEKSLVIGHINVGRISAIEGYVSPAASFEPDPSSDDFLSVLMRSGINLREHVDDIVFSLSPANNDSLTLSLAVLGSFTQQQAQAFMDAYYETEDHGKYLIFQKQDRLSCQLSPERAAIIQNGLLLVSDAENIQTLHNSLRSSPIDSKLPSEWQDFRDGQLASIGILNPEVGLKSLPGILRMMASGLAQQASLQSVYIGLQGNALPPQVGLTAQLTSESKQWLDMLHQQAQVALTNAQANSHDYPEILHPIVQRVDLFQEANRLGLSLSINQEIANNIKTTFNEGMGSLFSIGGSNDIDDTIHEEYVDDQAKPYAQTVDALAIPEFSVEYGHTPHWQSGPFGVFVKAVRINKQGLTELDISAIAQNMQNIPNDQFAHMGTLKIEAVEDINGNSILREETCGMQINHEPAPFKPHFNSQVEAKKSIRLKEGFTLKDIANIRGKIDFKVATQVAVETVNAPAQNVKVFGEEVLITLAQNSQLNFKANSKNILDIRPLNQNKQYLRTSSFGLSMVGGRANSPVSLNYTVQGKVQYVEVVKALDYHTFQNTFSLKNAYPVASDGDGSAKVDYAIYDETQFKQWVEQIQYLFPVAEKSWHGDPIKRMRAGPILVDFYEIKAQNGFQEVQVQSNINVSSPYLEGIAQYSNTAKLTLDEVLLTDHSTHSIQSSTFISLGETTKSGREVPHKSNYLYASNDMIKMLTGSTQINVPIQGLERLENDVSVISVQGRLTVQLPSKLNIHSMPFPSIGVPFDMGDITVTPVELTSSRLLLLITGAVDRIANIAAENEQNRSFSFKLNMRTVTTFDQFYTDSDGPAMVGELSLMNGRPSLLRIYESLESIQKEYPVSATNKEYRPR